MRPFAVYERAQFTVPPILPGAGVLSHSTSGYVRLGYKMRVCDLGHSFERTFETRHAERSKVLPKLSR